MDITLQDISAAYRRDTVLHEINWVITPGVTVVLGEHGAGKTTLLSILVGLIRPTSGTITTESTVDSSTRAGVPRFGYLPQRFSVVAGMRVIDTLSYAAWVTGTPRRACESMATSALSAVGLPDHAGSRVRCLSAGQRRLLGVAAGLACDPDALVLDEPMAGLEPAEQTLVRDVIARLGATRPVLLSTRTPQEVHALRGKGTILADGRLIFDGSLDEAEQALAAWRAGDTRPEVGRASSSVTGTLEVHR